MNFSTLLVLLIVSLLIGAAVRSIYKNKKEGNCCSGCSGCPGNCHKERQQ